VQSASETVYKAFNFSLKLLGVLSKQLVQPLEQGSPNIFVRGPHKLFSQTSEGRTSFIMWLFRYHVIKFFVILLLFNYWQNAFAGRQNCFAGWIWPAGRSLEGQYRLVR